MTTKELVHRLVDELPASELHVARRVLEYLRNVGTDPVLRVLMEAPEDDEPLTPEDEAAIAEAREAIARGEVDSYSTSFTDLSTTRYMTDEEAWEMLDQAAHRYLGMSGREFLGRWDAGEFPDPDSDPQVMTVATLIPLVRSSAEGT